jgi:hypothetical protein
MKGSSKPELALSVSLACLVLIFAGALNAQTGNSELKSAISPLGYFAGDWECSGKFDSSGKTIEARQHFAPDLDGAWMTFRHDDKPPFGYHSVAEWGWDANRKEFVMSAQDSGGGLRLFHSSGWNAQTLQWDGGAVGSSSDPDQRFSFERLDERHFKVSYFTIKNGAWSRVDSSTCSKQ